MSNSDDMLPKGVNKIMKDIITKTYSCPICKKIYRNESDAYACRNRCAIVKCEVSSLKEERYVTPCGCVFSTPGLAKMHIMIQKECCGYFKNETETGAEYYYITHAVDNCNYCNGAGILVNKEGIGFSKRLEIAGYSDSPFVHSSFAKNYIFKLQHTAKKIKSEEFDQGLKDCIDIIKESIRWDPTSSGDSE